MSPLLLALGVLAQVVIPPQAVLMDGVAAVVDREIITRSDVDRAARIQLARSGGGAYAARAPLDDGLRAAVLNLLIVEELITLECRRKQRFPETDEAVAAQAQKVKAAFPSDAAFEEFLRTLSMPEGDFLDLMRREVRVDLALAQVIKAVPAVTDAELDAQAALDPKLKDILTQHGRKPARDALYRRRCEDRAFQHVETLKKQTAVKVVPRFVASTPAAAAPAATP